MDNVLLPYRVICESGKYVVRQAKSPEHAKEQVLEKFPDEKIVKVEKIE